jgi:sRNA-binding protein
MMDWRITIEVEEAQPVKKIKIYFEEANAINIKAHATLSRLRSLFPNSIGNFSPLKINVHLDILMIVEDLRPEDLSAAMTIHTQCRKYLQNLTSPLRSRVDLWGNAVSEISAEDKFYANKRLEDKNSL